MKRAKDDVIGVMITMLVTSALAYVLGSSVGQVVR
jgi:hypothetical protein